jgi:methionyl aminopeptidase
VHGIPRPDQVLREGDLLSLDCGAILDGWHGDSAITVGVGETDPALLTMAQVAEDAMWAGIAAAARGVANGRGRLTDISFNVEKAIRRAGRYGIVDGYGGHGIGTEMHQDPHVLNHGKPGKGPRLVPGLALAIEPMITMGSPRTQELDDGWTVVTRDASVAAHVEHTICLLADGVWVTTAPDGGRGRLGDQVTARQP